MKKSKFAKIALLSTLVILFSFVSSRKATASGWSRVYTGVGTVGGANSINETLDGGYIVAVGDNYPLLTGSSFQVLKLRTDGSIEWQKDFGSGVANSVQQALDGGYVVAGLITAPTWSDILPSTIPPPPASAILILKLNADGSTAWQKIFTLSTVNNAYSIQPTSDGGCIVAGQADLSAWLLKLDTDGNIQWQKAYAGNKAFTFQSVQQTFEGGYIVAGYITFSDLWLVKLDVAGNLTWQKNLAGGFSRVPGISSVRQTNDGGYIIAGHTAPTDEKAYLNLGVIKVDQNGSAQWQKTYNLESSGGAISQTLDGGYIVGSSDTVLKLDENGNIEWQNAYGGAGFQTIQSIQQIPDGGYIVTGQWDGRSPFVFKVDQQGLIPNCGIITESNVIASSTDAIAKDADATVTDADGIGQISNFNATDANLSEVTLCFSAHNQDVVVNPKAIDYGPVPLGQYTDQTVTITNGGTVDTVIGVISSPPSPFSTLNDNCSNHTLVPGGSCTVFLRFSPLSLGDFHGIFNIPFGPPEGSIAGISLSGEGGNIGLLAPGNHSSFNACSLNSPPIFAWATQKPYKSYLIEFSKDYFNSISVKLNARGDVSQAKINSNTWKKILSIPSIEIYWRVRGKLSQTTDEFSNVDTIIIEPSKPVGSPNIADTNKHALPTLSWQNICNTKFRVWFGSDTEFTQEASFTFRLNPNSTGEEFTKRLTLNQWKAVRKLVGDQSDSRIYWYIESWDGLGRDIKTAVMSFTLTD